MRSPVIAFGIFAAAAVSPTLVSAVPTSPRINEVSSVPHVATADASAIHQPHVPRKDLPILDDPSETQHSASHKKHKGKSHKRATDGNTAGGNAYSGGTSDATGGSVINEGEDGEDVNGNPNTIDNNVASEHHFLS
jgi:hypothetical protein